MAEEGPAEPRPTDAAEARQTERRCIGTGQVRPVEQLIRFVVDPEGRVVPDLEARLPGRGMWLSARRDVVNTASAKNLFAKAARQKVAVPPDLAATIERLLARRCVELIGLARRAGQAVTGFEKVRGELKAGRGAVVIEAAEGAADGRDKIRALAPDLPLVAGLSGVELGTAFGRDWAVHALVTHGRLADRLLVEAGRLSGFRPENSVESAGDRATESKSNL